MTKYFVAIKQLYHNKTIKYTLNLIFLKQKRASKPSLITLLRHQSTVGYN